MNDDRLISALRRLGAEDLPMASDRAIRGRLETAWMAQGRRLPMAAFGLRRFVPVLAVVALAAGLAGSTLSAGADSPLWDTRIALEDAGAFLRQSNDDRVAYLRDLVQSRTEEAARQEAAGNPGAAAKARTAASAAIAELDGNIPHIDTTVPLPSPVASPSAAPTPANSPSPSPSHSASAVPAVQLPSSAPPTATRTPTATPTRTATRTPSPTPLPTTGTKQSTTITGTVRDAAGTNVTNACLSTSATAADVDDQLPLRDEERLVRHHGVDHAGPVDHALRVLHGSRDRRVEQRLRDRHGRIPDDAHAHDHPHSAEVVPAAHEEAPARSR